MLPSPLEPILMCRYEREVPLSLHMIKYTPTPLSMEAVFRANPLKLAMSLNTVVDKVPQS